jgi:hypothetical protein
MWTAFPSSDYYEASAPSRIFNERRIYPANLYGTQVVGVMRDGSHVHCEPIDQLGIQLCPGSLATATPQFFTVASPPASQTGYGVDLPETGCRALHPDPYPPDLSR